jgi:hypothetical protein
MPGLQRPLASSFEALALTEPTRLERLDDVLTLAGRSFD